MKDRLVISGSRDDRRLSLPEKSQKISRASPWASREGDSPTRQGFGRESPSTHGIFRFHEVDIFSGENFSQLFSEALRPLPETFL